jgi:GlpG protein
MRKIGELPEERQARVFSDALYARGLENDVESEDGGTFSIWIHDDDQLGKGRTFLEQFRAAPDAAEWQSATTEASRKRKEEAREDARRASSVITRERIEYERNFTGFAWLPLLLSIISVAVTIWAGELGIMPSSQSPTIERGEPTEAEAGRAKRLEQVIITKPRNPQTPRQFEALLRDMEKSGPGSRNVRRHFYDHSLPEIRSGQVWRLFSPIFLHFGILHLVFNIMWLRDLGGFLQHRFGAGYLAILVLAIAAISNLIQLVWEQSPMFGGLSGINYGLLGFLWMRGRFDRGGFWQLNPQIVQMMMIWFFLCFFVIPNVANGAHAGGLLFGMLIGFATAKFANFRRTRL